MQFLNNMPENAQKSDVFFLKITLDLKNIILKEARLTHDALYNSIYPRESCQNCKPENRSVVIRV